MKSGPGNISIGGYVQGSVVSLGSNVKIHNQVTWHASDLPRPETVDILAAIEELRANLTEIAANPKLTSTALDEAKELAASKAPPKDRVGDALKRALEYSGDAQKLVENGQKLWPTLKTIAGWLGAAAPLVLKVAGVALL